MTRISVWAPNADSIEVQLGGERRGEGARRVPMERDERDWWHAETDAGPGDDYAFVLEGAEPALPDPRSGWQPEGVDGPSRLVDLAGFSWSDAAFRAPPLASAVIYELHIGTFTPGGTFDSATERLGHIVDLGATHVEVMPVNEFSGDRGWGYDGVDLYAPHHAYGGPEAFARFVDACHAHGLAVILDVVYNHLGPSGNYLGRFGPYFTDRHTSPWGPAVNFDAEGSNEVRRFFRDNALMWLRDYHVDGLRLDAVHAIVDTSATHILEEIAAAVDELEAASGRPLVLIAESDLNDPRMVRPPEIGGYGMDAQWSDDFHHALHSVLTGEQSGYYSDFGRLAHLATALQRAYVYAGEHSRHRGRVHGREPTGIPGWRFLGYVQNHDQIGNRAQGDRLHHISSVARARVAAALVMTSPFVPMVFQGEEWAASSPFIYFTAHRDPGLADAVRTGRQQEFKAFGWNPADIPDPQDPASFERSRLDWSEPERGEHAEMLEWQRSLIALRRSTPSLTDGRLDRVRVEVDEGRGTLVLRRDALAVVVNLGTDVATLAVGARSLLLGSADGVAVRSGVVSVPPDAVAIVRSAHA